MYYNGGLNAYINMSNALSRCMYVSKKFVTIDISSSRWVNCISAVIYVVRVSKRTESLTMYRQSEYNETHVLRKSFPSSIGKISVSWWDIITNNIAVIA